MSNQPVHYTYSLSKKIFVYIFCLLISPALAFFSFVDLFGYFTNQKTVLTPYNSSGTPPRADMLVLFTSIYLLLIFSNVFPDLKISSAGIFVQCFLFWWVFIPWAEIEAIRPSIQSVRFIGSAGNIYLIIVQKLTPIHRHWGLLLGGTRKPVVLISDSLENYHDAMRLIRQNIGDERWL